MECWVFLLHKLQVKKDSVGPTDKLIECNNVPRQGEIWFNSYYKGLDIRQQRTTIVLIAFKE